MTSVCMDFLGHTPWDSHSIGRQHNSLGSLIPFPYVKSVNAMRAHWLFHPNIADLHVFYMNICSMIFFTISFFNFSKLCFWLNFYTLTVVLDQTHWDNKIYLATFTVAWDDKNPLQEIFESNTMPCCKAALQYMAKKTIIHMTTTTTPPAVWNI